MLYLAIPVANSQSNLRFCRDELLWSVIIQARNLDYSVNFFKSALSNCDD